MKTINRRDFSLNFKTGSDGFFLKYTYHGPADVVFILRFSNFDFSTSTQMDSLSISLLSVDLNFLKETGRTKQFN